MRPNTPGCGSYHYGLLHNDTEMFSRWIRYYHNRRRRAADTYIGETARFQEVNRVVPAPKYEPMPYDVFMAARIADYEIGQ